MWSLMLPTQLDGEILANDVENNIQFYSLSSNGLCYSMNVNVAKYYSSPNISSALMEVLGRLTTILNPAADLKGKMEMSHQIQEYECLVNKLKEELRVEKLKAKEVAEDLT
ncbi:hypothetical protein Ahy_A07g036024 isoform B [Arachis hypogaea]|uniref:Uncharacterized protein n=1 Tax=Arachis hypogaea TaxID=3818 RepID=A0A445CF15_ARAHY|nr:hypothetical protein Ahy_A07g036024 isoform B [Arachis hypogaea]